MKQYFSVNCHAVGKAVQSTTQRSAALAFAKQVLCTKPAAGLEAQAAAIHRDATLRER